MNQNLKSFLYTVVVIFVILTVFKCLNDKNKSAYQIEQFSPSNSPVNNPKDSPEDRYSSYTDVSLENVQYFKINYENIDRIEITFSEPKNSSIFKEGENSVQSYNLIIVKKGINDKEIYKIIEHTYNKNIIERQNIFKDNETDDEQNRKIQLTVLIPDAIRENSNDFYYGVGLSVNYGENNKTEYKPPDEGLVGGTKTFILGYSESDSIDIIKRGKEEIELDKMKEKIKSGVVMSNTDGYIEILKKEIGGYPNKYISMMDNVTGIKELINRLDNINVNINTNTGANNKSELNPDEEVLYQQDIVENVDDNIGLEGFTNQHKNNPYY
jgi:hypothetical protein